MKRFLSLVICFTIILLTNINYHVYSQESLRPEIKGLSIESYKSVNKVYKAYKKGSSLIKNISFTDIDDSNYKRDIIKMAALSIIKGYGDKTFKPDKYLTVQETINLLVRMYGLEREVQRNIAESSEELQVPNMINNINEYYTSIALNNGIIKEDDEYYNGNSYISREQALVWIGNLIGLEPVYGDIQIIYTYKDFEDITYKNLGIIESILQEGIYYGKNGYLKLNNSITRGEMINLLNKIDSRLYERRNLSLSHGIVVDKKIESTYINGKNVTKTKYLIVNLNGMIDIIEITKGYLENDNENIVVYKNEKLGDYSVLHIGDEIEYITRDNEVVYIEVKNTSNILESIKEVKEKNKDIKVYDGMVVLKTWEKHWKDNDFYFIDRFTIRNSDGKEYDIICETDLNNNKKYDVIVYKNNHLGGCNLLEEGDEVEYFVKDDKYVIFIRVKDFMF